MVAHADDFVVRFLPAAMAPRGGAIYINHRSDGPAFRGRVGSFGCRRRSLNSFGSSSAFDLGCGGGCHLVFFGALNFGFRGLNRPGPSRIALGAPSRRRGRRSGSRFIRRRGYAFGLRSRAALWANR